MAGPDIDEIATFVRVVRRGSLAAAARELDLPKSTISRRIARLEERLNTELLHRAARRVQVTASGRRLYDRVADPIDAIELAAQGVRTEADLPRGKIRITAPTDFGRLILIDELISFATACPEISVEVQLTDRFVDLAAEGFDLAIRAGTSPQSSAAQSLIARQLEPSSLQLAASPELAERVRSIDDLQHVPFVLFRSREMHQRLKLRTPSGQAHELTVHGRFCVHDYPSMAELVVRGVGVGLMPAMHIDRAPTDRQLVRILPHLSANAGSIAIVYPTRRLPMRVRVLIDHLTKRLAPSSRV